MITPEFLLEGRHGRVQDSVMRWDCVVLLGGLALFGSGCAGGHTSSDPLAPISSGHQPTNGNSAKPPALIVTPVSAHRGRIILVNATARYVVLNCPFGYIPALDHRMNVYRSGLKVGEIKITGPQRDTSTVGDIVDGDCQVGDEAREE